jgi:serine/threonine-protein kinase
MDANEEHAGTEPFHNLMLATECLFDVGPARVEGDLLGEIRTRLSRQVDFPLKLGDRKAVLTKILAINAMARIESGRVVSHFWKMPYGEPDWVNVLAGSFWMGSEEFEDEKPIHEVYLADYQVARTLITNAQYGIYIKDTNANAPDHWRGQQIPAGLENHPVVNITWYEAIEYCNWLSGKIHRSVTLPSEAEWEKAARGSFKKRDYPWGKWAELHCNTDQLGIGSTTPVGLFLNGESPYGVLDMSGNVWEWTGTIKKRYPYDAKDGRDLGSSIKSGVKSKDLRIIRGGSFADGKGGARCAFRFWDLPGNKLPYYGFRVVLTKNSIV